MMRQFIFVCCRTYERVRVQSLVTTLSYVVIRMESFRDSERLQPMPIPKGRILYSEDDPDSRELMYLILAKEVFGCHLSLDCTLSISFWQPPNT